jgi:F420-non-reducing hydrogenase small subunit
MTAKPKVAFYWLASCGGCEETVLDLAADVLSVTGAVDIVFWPVAMDFKRADLESLADGSLAAAFVNGGVRTSEQEEMAKIVRRKAQAVIAFGSCAHLGGVPGLANLTTREAILDRVYGASERPQIHSKPNGHSLELPELWEEVAPLDRVVEVEYYLPGCPPPARLVKAAVEALLTGNLPPRGAVLAPDRALCEECPRRDSKPEDLSLAEYRRPHAALIDAEKCLLAQGFACLGAATRSGCEAVCIQGNMPCTGCMGPTSRVSDFGAKALSSLASISAAKEDAQLAAAFAGLPDPAGTFYRYSLPASLVARRPAKEH